jgi:hypothetical protein
MQRFAATASMRVQELEAQYDAMDRAFAAAVSLYGEDPKATTPEEFLSIFARFMELWAVRDGGRGSARRWEGGGEHG